MNSRSVLTDIYIVVGDDVKSIKEKAKAMGINYMPWLVKDKMLLIYKNMLPNVNYKNGVNAVVKFDRTKSEDSQRGDVFIGEYAPIGKLLPANSFVKLKNIPQF